MAYCSKCGAKIDEGVKFCPACGARVQRTAEDFAKDVGDKFQNFNETEDMTSRYMQSDIQSHKGVSVLAYLGIFVLIPLLTAKDSPYARFHTNQGVVLLLLNIALNIVRKVLSLFLAKFVMAIVSLLIGAFLLTLAVIGIVNAATGKAKELPVIGSLRIMK